ncbi:IQ domain-containing protein E isoform X6 [Bos javanicus]|uniref:IQ domain-containing protein E isoform X6 n=1 Tax=Bos javanicus TaxID=9906 RepID=UPI002AA77118|nr:IQ domain-containing protein E isoform X6 [Bos javanicus]
MSQGTAEPASETGDDSLSVITFDSDSDTKAKKKSFHKPPPTSLKSPYHSKPRKVASWRSLRTAASMPLGGRMSLTPQKLCLGSSKQGSLTPALTSGLTLDCAWTHSPSSAPDFVTEALRMKRSNLRRSASHGYVPGNPVYREKEDMYDEIIELKKSLNMQKSDVDLMRTKLRRLEEENSRKDRQIEQLLDASRGPDFVRTLAEKRPDAGWVINGLKQRVLKLEQQCKEKDNIINKLQTDVKTTNLEEMRIAMETYYEEIHRLHGLLASSEMTGKRPPVEKKIGLKRQKKMSSALLSLSRSVQELTEENQSLKEDLDRMLSNSPTASKIKGYTDWSKPRLVRRIAELEKKLSSMESPKPQASEAARSTSLTPSASSPTLHLQENERLHGAVKSLKGERSALHTQLQERDLEVKQLLQTKAELEKELESMKEGERERREREKALREEVQTLTRKFQELEGSKKDEEDEPVAAAPQTHEEPSQPPSPTASPSQPDAEPDWSQGGSSRPPSTCSEGRRDEAARVLQRRWKGYQRQKERALLDEAATVLQAAFRGHLARARLLSRAACVSEPPRMPSPPTQDSPEPRIPSPAAQAEGDPWQEEAVTIIQSAFRAHLARARHRAGRQRGERQGDRQGAGSRGRSAEAATLLRLNIWKFTVHVLLKPGLENLQPSRANTQKRCPFHYRGLECKSRKSRDTGVTGKFGLGVQNEAGQRLIEFCQENALVIANTLFQQHKRRLYTWTSPDGQHRNQTDYILCSQRWRSSTQSAKTRPGADCGSDHELLIAKFRLKLKKVGKTTRPFRYDLNQIPK